MEILTFSQFIFEKQTDKLRKLKIMKNLITIYISVDISKQGFEATSIRVIIDTDTR